jgi:Protein of unknown function (DUF1566)
MGFYIPTISHHKEEEGMRNARIIILVEFFLLWIGTIAFAGDLEPSGPPGSTMHTLDEIFNQVAHIGVAPVEKTGQTTSYATGDDGDHESGIPWSNPRFTDNGNGTVTDNLTGLTWLQDANRYGWSMTWEEALNVCNNLTDDGSSLTDGSSVGDWRLPNIKELQSLIDYGNYDPALPDGHVFLNVPVAGYWSSTTDPNENFKAWYIEIVYGAVDHYSKVSCELCRFAVWPVRGGN